VQDNLSKRCCDTSYKLILMDLNMPVMDGFEATQKILKFKSRREAITKEYVPLTIVAVTAYVNEEFVSRCYEVGMADVLHKPVSKEELKRVLDSYYYEHMNV